MRRSSSVPAMIALAAVLSAPVIIKAQNSLTASVTLPATTLFAGGMRANHMPIAPDASVYTAQNDRIGSIADVRIGNRGDIRSVVLWLGGFRGMPRKLVEVPGSLIQIVDDKLVIIGATRDQLMQLPEYRYGSRS